MKKTIITLLAVAAAVVSCSKEQTISTGNGGVIGFTDSFVDNATKALDNDYSGTKTLSSLNVWGTVTGNANTLNVFDGVQIVREGKEFGQAWNYANPADAEYWVPYCTYNFAAVVDGTVIKTNPYGMPEQISYSLSEDGDLLYALASATTDVSGTPSGNIENSCVSFTFSHLLSKVRFSVSDPFSGGDYAYKISDIKVYGIPSSGVYTVGSKVDDGTWATNSELTADNALNFGTATNDYLIFPVEQTLTVEFSYDVLFKGTKISTISVSKALTHTFAQSTVYNIQIELPALGNEIKFTVSAVPGGFTAADSDINVM